MIVEYTTSRRTFLHLASGLVFIVERMCTEVVKLSLHELCWQMRSGTVLDVFEACAERRTVTEPSVCDLISGTKQRTYGRPTRCLELRRA